MSDHDDKKSRIEKEPDPNALVAIRAREQVCDDREISDGAARLFVRLLDLALNPFMNNGRKGEIIISQMKLGCFLNCDERTIRRHADELVRGNYVWTSLIPRPNTKPILCYHMTAFQPKRQAAQEMPGDGLWGNGKRRYDSGFTRTGRAASGKQTGQNCPVFSGLVDRFGKQIFFNLHENTPASGQECPPRADKIDRSERTELSSGSGQNCPVTEDRIVLSQRSELSGDSGQNCPVRAGGDVRHKESQQEVQGVSESELPTSLSVQRVNALEASEEKPKKTTSANAFLLEMAEVMELWKKGFGKTELTNSGAWWRKCFNEKPDKARTVLMDIRAGIKEGRKFSINPGAAAVDLWGRLP